MLAYLITFAAGGALVLLLCRSAFNTRNSDHVKQQPPEKTPNVLGSSSSEVESDDAMPSYQTAPLSDYQPQYQRLAESLFATIKGRVPSAKAVKYKGSYSFIRKDGKTMAKIIIIEANRGRKNRDFAVEDDGVYLLKRCDYAGSETLGVAPKHDERFTYSKVDPMGASPLADALTDFLARATAA